MGGVLLNRRTWTVSSSVGDALATDITLVEVRGIANAVVEQWELVQGKVQNYGKWINSGVDGSAVAANLVQLVLAVPSGFEVYIYENGVQKLGQLLGPAGEFIGNTIHSVVDGIKHVLGGGIHW